jgi:large conductance mechanosensitive channel
MPNSIMKKFTNEFKTFINRGNVVDMAVGVIVGSSFTAIVTSISNNILKPLINWLLSLLLRADSLNELYTFLKTVYVLDETGAPTAEIDLKQSIYIDWGTFINTVINFFLVAFVLFIIVKLINRFRQEQKAFSRKLSELYLDREERKELREAGISFYDKKAVQTFYRKKKELAEEQKAAEAAAAEEAKKRDRENHPTTEDLLKQILETLKSSGTKE